MSTTVTPAREHESLAPRVAALERETQGLAQSLGEARRTRLLILLLLVAFVCATCFAFYRLATRFQQPEQLQLLRTKAEEKLRDKSDLIVKEAQTLVDNAAPALQTAFMEQFNKDLPTYMQAVGAEREALVENLQKGLQVKLEAHHQQLLERHQALLREEFPAVKDEELHARMMANLQVAVNRLVKKYYIDEVHDQMFALYGLWDEFPMADPAASGELPLADQIYGNVWEWFFLRIKSAEPGAAPSL